MELQRPIKNTKLDIPDEVDEIRMSLDRPRLIKVTGVTCKYQAPQGWHLKITAKGRICLT